MSARTDVAPDSHGGKTKEVLRPELTAFEVEPNSFSTAEGQLGSGAHSDDLCAGEVLMGGGSPAKSE